ERERWDRLDELDLQELREQLAELPSEHAEANPDARDFDLRCVAMQVALLHGARSLPAQIEEMVDIAGRLLDKRAVPQVAAQQCFLESLQEEATWQAATVAFIEKVRRELRQLVGFLDPRSKRPPVYTNFEDKLLLGSPAESDVDV